MVNLASIMEAKSSRIGEVTIQQMIILIYRIFYTIVALSVKIPIFKRQVVNLINVSFFVD